MCANSLAHTVVLYVGYKYQLSQMNPRDGIVLQTELDDQDGYIFYAGGSIAGVSCRRRWPPPTTLALTTLVAQCELSRR